MPFVILSKNITPKTVDSNPDKIFIFGDNCRRAGNGGQAYACRGKKNTIGLATKHSPGGAPEDFFEETPEDLILFCEEILRVEHLAKTELLKGKTVVWLEGIGMGLAGLGGKPIYVFLINQLKENLRNYSLKEHQYE